MVTQVLSISPWVGAVLIALGGGGRMHCHPAGFAADRLGVAARH